jgi:dolichol-phosphate mannosyltransferase
VSTQTVFSDHRFFPGDGEAAVRPLVTVVMPAHDEGHTIAQTLGRIGALAEIAPDLAGRIDVVVVSDGSTDETFEEAQRGLRASVPGTVVELAANAGSHAAIRCGLRYARGEYVAVMAADGQDPPEALPAMLDALRPQVDVVWGRRRDRSADGRATRLAARLYYAVFRLLTGLEYPADGLDFVVMRGAVAEAVLAHAQRNACLFLLIFNLGFVQTFVDYDRGARSGGRSSWTVRKRAKLATDMLTSFSPAPIRLVSLIGMAVGVVGIAIGGVTLVRALLGSVPVPGWASLMVVTCTMGGFMLLAIAVMGEYVWRTLDEVRERPLFIEARHARVPDADAEAPRR